MFEENISIVGTEKGHKKTLTHNVKGGEPDGKVYYFVVGVAIYP